MRQEIHREMACRFVLRVEHSALGSLSIEEEEEQIGYI
jgi:hypothetical protein